MDNLLSIVTFLPLIAALIQIPDDLFNFLERHPRQIRARNDVERSFRPEHAAQFTMLGGKHQQLRFGKGYRKGQGAAAATTLLALDRASAILLADRKNGDILQ